MLQVLEAYGDSHNIDDFINKLFCCGSKDQVQQILEDIRNLGQLQESMENLRQQMQENGLETEGLVNGFNTARDQYLSTTLVQGPMENLRQEIGEIFSNARNQELRELHIYYDNHESLSDLFQEVDALLTLPFNDLKWLMAEVKEKSNHSS